MISIESLKSNIESRKNLSDFYVFLYSDIDFMPLQYAQEISKINNQSITLEELDNLPRKSFFDVIDNTLYVCFIDEFKVPQYIPFENSIIICNKIDKDTKALYEDNLVEFPKLEKWQIKDYVYSNCEGVDQKQLDWLIETCRYDIYKLDREISKLNIFDTKVRQSLFNNFKQDGIIGDDSDKTIFDFTDAIIKKDWNKLNSIYQKIEYCDVEPLGVVTILLKNFRNIINIQLGKNPTAESCGLSGKQFYVIKTYNCGLYNREQLIRIYYMLLSIDKYLKTGYLENDNILSYIVTYIYGVI